MRKKDTRLDKAIRRIVDKHHERVQRILDSRSMPAHKFQNSVGKGPHE